MLQISTERVQDLTRLGGQVDPLGNVQETKIWPYEQMVYAQPSTCPRNATHKLLWDFDIHTDHLNSARKPDLIIINNNKKREFAKLSTLLSQRPQNRTERMWKEG